MRKVKVIICDDEEDARLLLRQYLSDFPDMELIMECGNGLESVQAIDGMQPDLVFLDIQMPGLNGFQVLGKIRHIPQIIFSTAYDSYALKAFDNNAVDYLLKPYTRERFTQALQKVLKQNLHHYEGIQQLDFSLSSSDIYPERVFVESASKMMALPVKEIDWIEADGDYSRIHAGSRFYISRFGISNLEEKLNPASFVRIHRSVLVNLQKIRSLEREAGSYFVLMSTGETHKVGRTYVEVLRKWML